MKVVILEGEAGTSYDLKPGVQYSGRENAGKAGGACPTALRKSGCKITVRVDNPKRANTASFDRFELYAGAATVGEFLKAGGIPLDVSWDFARGHIALELPDKS